MLRRSTRLLLALVVLVAACGGDDPDPSAAVDEGGPVVVGADRDLYAEVPDPVPDGEAGAVLAVQELDPGELPASRLVRVLYRSESIAGDPIAVSGVVAFPEGEVAGRAARDNDRY